jgi:succinate-semialdehyde dehydrogenase/glutarate-semialdehyde dehydrogenase
LVERGRAAQEHWSHRPLDERVAALSRAAREMLRSRSEAILLARDEIGKLEAEGLFNETLGPLDAVAGWARVVRRATQPQAVRLNPINFPGKQATIEYVPRGVVGIIAPWNFPIAGLYRAVLPALLTGNAVIVKPSPFTPRSSSWFVDRLAAELPLGLAQCLLGDRAAGEALIDAGIDACVFTGSTRSGRSVQIHCAERGIPCSAEMGGKDAAIVLRDCDLAHTVAGITHWTLSNAGQACAAIEIAYVDAPIADEFVARVSRVFSALDRTSVAPLANQNQFDIVASHVNEARTSGATVVTGGYALEGLWYAPTLLDRCSARMTVVREETFGPVLAVVRVAGVSDAIAAVNRGRYGLGASIWTSDVARAKRLAGRLDVGIVNINNHAFSSAIPSLPWSGTRDTGFGVANSALALPTFVRPRVTTVDLSKNPEPYFMPYDQALTELGTLLADAQLGKISQAWKIPLLLRRRLQRLQAFFR